jgi:ribosomal-protein-alanine N-acetyltransferase
MTKNPLKIPSFETERLILRACCEEDLNGFADIYGDPEFMRFLRDGVPLDRVEVWRSLAWALGHWAIRGYGVFAVELKGKRALIGRVGLIFAEGWPSPELAWAIGRRWWGQGYAVEAAEKARSWADSSLNLPPLISLIRPENRPSIRVAEKLGATLTSEIDFFGSLTLVYTHPKGAR